MWTQTVKILSTYYATKPNVLITKLHITRGVFLVFLFDSVQYEIEHTIYCSAPHFLSVLWVTLTEGFHKTKINSHDGSSTTKAGLQLETVFTMFLKGEQYTLKR